METTLKEIFTNVGANLTSSESIPLISPLTFDVFVLVARGNDVIALTASVFFPSHPPNLSKRVGCFVYVDATAISHTISGGLSYPTISLQF
jgi:hypothetical protein